MSVSAAPFVGSNPLAMIARGNPAGTNALLGGRRYPPAPPPLEDAFGHTPGTVSALDSAQAAMARNALVPQDAVPVSPMRNALAPNAVLPNALAPTPAPVTASPPAMAQQPVAMPQPGMRPPGPGQQAQASPPAPAGQQMANQVLATLAPDKMSDKDLASSAARMDHLQNALRAQLQQKSIDHGDMAKVLGEAMKAGVVPAKEGPEILASLPSDPAALRAEVERRHLIALHAAVHLAGEQRRRAGRKDAA